MMTFLLILLTGLCLIQILLAIPLTFRLFVETVNTVDLWLHFGIKLPFDWEYVRKGASR
jgi:hypothetical protein